MTLFRPARPADLPAAAHVYAEAHKEVDLRLRGTSKIDEAEEAGAVADLVELQKEGADRVWVAVDGEAVVGIAAALIRERLWLLDYFFVLPEYQGRGVGRELLTRIHDAGVAAGCTIFSLFASEDPRAWTRYLSLGLFPQPPMIIMGAKAPRLPPVPWDDGLAAQPLALDDPASLATVGDLDKVVRGCRRPRDIERWLASGASGTLLTRRDTGAPTGYYLTGIHSDRVRIGPVVALDEERVATILTRALAAAEPFLASGLPWRIQFPSQNGAVIAPLLAAGFRPRFLSTFFSSAPFGQLDRYVIHDEDHL